MIPDQGELAVEISYENGAFVLHQYKLPENNKTFREEELKEVWVEASRRNFREEDSEMTEVLDSFFSTKSRQESTGKEQPTEKTSNSRSVPLKTLSQMHNEIKNKLRPEKAPEQKKRQEQEAKSVFAGKKYKPVDKKVRPILAELPAEFRIERNITGDPLKDLPELSTHPKEFVPTGRYTQERKDFIDKVHPEGFLWEEERLLMHELMMKQNDAFAWEASERGVFKEEYFPPVKFPVVEHKPWVLKNIPIPPGQFDEVCKILKEKIEANVYEPSNSSYRSRWFCVIKKDGKSLRMVQSLEPLNAVTIAHSGVPPATETLAEQFAGRACLASFDLFVGYDNRTIHPDSRDYTTIQTPFGPLRLVKLPMGWTNSVPIFHDDVTYIFREEIPDITVPYIDDVPVKGPASRYQRSDGSYETIPENPKIRRFVWEHFNNLNRICQRMKYAGGTFSGKKTILCADEVMVVGHLCSSKGRKVQPDKLPIIQNWGPCKNQTDVRSFLGVAGVFRMYIKDYAKIVSPMNMLLRNNVPFKWGEEQQQSMDRLKEAMANAPCLLPIRNEWDTDVVLAVDTSWMAIGFYIYQEDPEDKKKRYYARFGSITLNEVEASYHQPKRELYGLKRALEACCYWLLGCRRLIVETDAAYLAGMLNNPGKHMNATINRWVSDIRMYQFELRHVRGKTFPVDGLSRREYYPGDEEYPRDPRDLEEDQKDIKVHVPKGFEGDILDFETYKDQVDTRGGYLLETCPATLPFVKDLELVQQLPEVKNWFSPLATKPRSFLPDPDTVGPYNSPNRSDYAKLVDEKLLLIKQWLKDRTTPKDWCKSKTMAFIRLASRFIMDKQGRVYRKGTNAWEHRIVVGPELRMYIMTAAHDKMAHRGIYPTLNLISRRFWWPDMDRDVRWFVKTCDMCQSRQKVLIQIPPVVTYTPPSIFHTMHD